MATARLFIPVGTQSYGPVPGGVDTTEVVGSNTAEIISIAANGNVILEGSFVRGNDCIKINGLAGDYLISANAAGIILTGKVGTPSEGASISIPAFGAGGGLKIDFLNITDVDLTTSNGTTFVLNGPGSADQTITSTSTALTIAGGTTGGGGGSGNEFDLTVAADNLTGTSGIDTFYAITSVNQNGEQTNQLQTGDRLNGGAGFDTLDAEVQDASALNGRPVAEIILRTSDVEHLKINAEQAESSGDDDSVELDLERAYGVEALTSSFSDASLVFYNVNTLGDGGLTDAVNGLDNGRPTASIEICMDHTSGENVLYCASDLEVYFDADYLIPGQPTRETVIRLQLMDIDNNLISGQPLKTNPYDRIFIDLPGGKVGFADPDVTLVINPSSFSDSGVAAYTKLVASINAGLASAGLTTYTASLGNTFQVTDPDGNPGGSPTGWEILITDSSGTVLTPANFEFGASGSIPSQTDYQKQIFVNSDVQTDLITSILCVEKVGSGGDGGDFIVGSMSTGGVERFILEMKGNDAGTGGVNVDQDSSLASLTSTNNVLREVILWAESDVTADITIGNSVTDGRVPNIWSGSQMSWEESVSYDDEYCGHLYPDGNPCDLTDTRNNAMRDVQLFTAAGAQGKAALNSNVDVTLYAHLSAEFTGKYLDLMDDAVDHKADNIVATYLFAGGNDHLNMNISKVNFAFSGAATREDFAFLTNTGAGNDIVEIQIGDGDFGEYEDDRQDTVPIDVAEGSIEELGSVFGDSSHWYTNHMLNDNLLIQTGSGNDFVNTWGSTAATIELGSGDDIVYTDNSGGGEYNYKTTQSDGYGYDFNCCRATWVFNAQSDQDDRPQVNDLLSFGRGQITNACNFSIFIHYQDLLVQWEVGGSWGSVNGVTITDLTINQAIKDAVNNHPVLSSFLVAKDGPSGTLLVLSKVDGEHLASDFSIGLGRSLGADGSPVPLTPAQLAPGTTGRLFGTYTAAELNGIGFTTAGAPYTNSAETDPGQGSRWDSEFGWDGGKMLDGVDSDNVNNNRVWGSTGSDDIALSSNWSSIEHVIIKKASTENFGTDYIMNFTAAITPAIIPEEAEEQEICITMDDDAALQDFDIEITIDGQLITVAVEAGDDAATINNLIVEAIEGSSVSEIVEATIDDNGTLTTDDDCVNLVYEAGEDFDLATAVIVPVNPTEIQSLTVSAGPSNADAIFTVIFDGVSAATPILPAGSTDTQIAAAIAAAVNGAGSALVTASSSGGVVTLNYFGSVDPALAVTGQATTSQNVNVVSAVVQAYAAFDPGVSVDTTGINDGAPQINPALGYDIFDVSDIVGFPGPVWFHNDLQDNSAGAEYFEVNRLVDANANGVLLIDTLDGGAGEFAYTGAPTSELARLQQMVTAADADTPDTTTRTSVIITVRNNGVTDAGLSGVSDGFVGNFYQLDDPAGNGNATVTYLGTAVLLGYDSIAANKDPIGNWDAMTVANFTHQTPTQLMDTYIGGII